MWFTWLIENAGRKKSPSGHHSTTLSGYIFATKACIDNRKQLYLLHMSLQYGELRPTSGWDHFVSLGHPSKFQRVSRLGFVTAVTLLNGSQPNFAWCLAISCAATLYIHFWWLLPRNRSLPGAKCTLRLQVLCSPVSSVTARHSSSGHKPNFAALSTGRHLYSAGRPSRWAFPHSSLSDVIPKNLPWHRKTSGPQKPYHADNIRSKKTWQEIRKLAVRKKSKTCGSLVLWFPVKFSSSELQENLTRNRKTWRKLAVTPKN